MDGLERAEQEIPGRRSLLRGAAVAGLRDGPVRRGGDGGERLGAHRAHRDYYVALGDSYASGPGIPTQTDATCARSDQNYPRSSRRRGTGS
ncbi:hypothetical protein ACRAWF_36175 [Streptomyces sp. L7]